MAQPPAGTPPPAGSPARPQQVTAAAIVLFVAGGLAILSGLLAFGFAFVGAIVVVIAVINIGIGAAAIYAGLQILQLREQGRMLGLVISGVGALFALIGMFSLSYLQILPLLGYGFVGYTLWTNAQLFHR